MRGQNVKSNFDCTPTGLRPRILQWSPFAHSLIVFGSFSGRPLVLFWSFLGPSSVVVLWSFSDRFLILQWSSFGPSLIFVGSFSGPSLVAFGLSLTILGFSCHPWIFHWSIAGYFLVFLWSFFGPSLVDLSSIFGRSFVVFWFFCGRFPVDFFFLHDFFANRDFICGVWKECVKLISIFAKKRDRDHRAKQVSLYICNAGWKVEQVVWIVIFYSCSLCRSVEKFQWKISVGVSDECNSACLFCLFCVFFLSFSCLFCVFFLPFANLKQKKKKTQLFRKISAIFFPKSSINFVSLIY